MLDQTKITLDEKIVVLSSNRSVFIKPIGESSKDTAIKITDDGIMEITRQRGFATVQEIENFKYAKQIGIENWLNKQEESEENKED